jgi:putative tricarboxylic transport membrane protein
MIRSDRVFGLATIVVALGYILSATTIEQPIFPDPLGPTFFPYLIAAGAILASLTMILRPDAEPSWPAARSLFGIALSVAVMVGYALTLKPLGFLIPTAVAAGMISYLIGPRVVPAILTGLGLSGGLFLIFKYALGLGLVAVPKGWLG